MLGYHHGICDELLQSAQRILLVLFLGPVFLGLDDDDAILGQSLTAECQQSLLIGLGQRGMRNVKTEMDGAGDLVDILAPGPAGPDKMDLDFIIRDAYYVGYL